MSHNYEKTSVPLYRAIFLANYTSDVRCYLAPDRDLADAKEIAPILHPQLLPSLTPRGDQRPADIQRNASTGMYHPDTGGTSVFDSAKALRRADGDFHIPAGTDIPPDLKVSKDAYNDRLKAIHYTIMPAKPMFKDALLGSLDNFVRNAIRRQYEAARGIGET
ncbi:Tse2 family ADP-ribosyltransferase toxin [Rhizobacter sp. P5_C2]